MEPLLLTRQAASMLGVSRWYIMSRVKDKTLPVVRLSRNRIRFRASDLEVFVASKVVAAIKQ